MSEEKPAAAFILSLVAGVLITLGGCMSLIFMSIMGGMLGIWREMMGGYGMTGFPIWRFGMVFGVVGLIIGIIVIIAALMLDSKPQEHKTWGAIILIFSIISVIGGMGGFGIGLILGIIGGALAISWTPPASKPASIQQSVKYCVQCGKPIVADAKYCTHCGKEQLK